MTIKVRHIDSAKEWTFHDQAIKLVWTEPPVNTNIAVAAIKNMIPYLAHDAVVVLCLDFRISHTVPALLSNDLRMTAQKIWLRHPSRSSRSWWGTKHDIIAIMTVKDENNIFTVPRHNYNYNIINIDPILDESMWNYKQMERVIQPFVDMHTIIEEYVADPFAGSGKVAEVAFRSYRNFIGQELSMARIKELDALFNRYRATKKRDRIL